MVKFGYTIIYVESVEKAIVFFEQAFGMSRKFITESKDYGELSTGSTTLSFAAHELGRQNFAGGYVSGSDSVQPLGIEIALTTSDVDAAHKRALEHGAIELKSPEQKPWGQAVSYLRCPAGVLIELCTPIES